MTQYLDGNKTYYFLVESHLGGLYWEKRDTSYSIEEQEDEIMEPCDECGDNDWVLGMAGDLAEAKALVSKEQQGIASGAEYSQVYSDYVRLNRGVKQSLAIIAGGKNGNEYLCYEPTYVDPYAFWPDSEEDTDVDIRQGGMLYFGYNIGAADMFVLPRDQQEVMDLARYFGGKVVNLREA